VGDKRGFSKAMTASFGLRVIFFKNKNAKMKKKINQMMFQQRQTTSNKQQTPHAKQH
jgi:hypothetical protein